MHLKDTLSKSNFTISSFSSKYVDHFSFVLTEWKADDEDEEDKKLWEDDWDDDNVDDDFSKQLRYESDQVIDYALLNQEI